MPGKNATGTHFANEESMLATCRPERQIRHFIALGLLSALEMVRLLCAVCSKNNKQHPSVLALASAHVSYSTTHVMAMELQV